MKTLVAFLLGLCLTTSVWAQDVFQIGARFGANLADIEANELYQFNGDSIAKITGGEEDLGYHVGLYARVKILGLYIQPEVLITSLKTQIEVGKWQGSEPGEGSETETLNITRLDFPLMAGLKMGPVRLQGGPIASRVINSTSQNNEIQFQETTWGYQAGIGFDIWRFLLDFKYESGFGNVTESITINGNQFNFDSRTSQLIVSMGYRF